MVYNRLTGCGKTLIAIKAMEMMKELNPQHRVVLFVPTGPLVSQQAGYIRRESDLTVLELSGQHKVGSSFEGNPLEGHDSIDALVVTPQFFLNMLHNEHITVTDFSMMVFDEAHHATGKHPYRDILEKLATLELTMRPRILGLTASPFGEQSREGSGQRALRKLCNSFNAELNAPTMFTDELEQSFIPKEAQWTVVEESDDERKLRSVLKTYIESFFREISDLSKGRVMLYGTNYDNDDSELSQFLAKLRSSEGNITSVIQMRSSGDASDRTVADQDMSDLKMILAHVRKVASSFYNLSIYGSSQVTKALLHMFDSLAMKTADRSKRKYSLVKARYETHLQPTLKEFPHYAEVATRVRLIAQVIRAANFTHDSRAIVFVRRRHTAIELAKAMEQLDELRELNPTRFVGHNSFEGMTWEIEQKPTLERFRQGRIRLLVATNVLEEGLDVPECSLVIQFDGVTGVTSLIQSRGRARHRHSSFVIFCSPAGKEHCERLVEHEKHLILNARITAASLSSKVIVERLLRASDDTSTSGDEVLQVVGARKLVNASIPKFDENSASNYSVVLGGRPASESQDAQDKFLGRLGEVKAHASVIIVDHAVGLCTLKVSPDADALQSYDLLCNNISFRSDDEMFWVRFESMEKFTDSCDAGNVYITDVTLRRGLFTEHDEFVELDRVRHTGTLELDSNAIVVNFLHVRRVVFDLRSLSDYCVRFNWSAKSTVSIHLSTLIPPHYFADDERECVNCQFRALQYVIDIPKLQANLESLWHVRSHFMKYGSEVRDTWIHEASFPANNASQAPFERSFELDVAYGLQCFLSGHSYFLDGTLPPAFFGTLDQLNPNIQASALISFRPSPALGSIVDQFDKFVKNEVEVLETMANSTHLNRGKIVYKTVVTPTRVVFCPPEPAPNNRVFRHWGAENFMYVYFRDENMERLDYTDEKLLERIRTVMSEGITVNNVVGNAQDRPQGLLFRFLGCSLSQVRNSSAIFTLLDPHEIRSWVGNLSHLVSPAKYFKRLGQAFSATRETFPLNQNVLDNPVEDISNDRYVFTDGCGQISVAGAASIVTSLQLSFMPSAFQIRVGGAKGVVVVSDLDDRQQSLDYSVVLRKSMSKFMSSHNMLEIVAWSGRSTAYLTRQSIQILSDLGIDEGVFMEMQEDYLDTLRSLLASDGSAFFELKSVLPPSVLWWIEILVRQKGVKIFADEFLFSLVRTIYNYRMTNTLLRARIPIAKGRTLMGVADFTNTLQYGEIFVHYTELDEESGIERHVTLDDVDVVVHRSPCHHPGDIRVLRCRSDVPDELRRLKDCVVFPSNGPRPHPDECTGGDLDGDVFVVIWDERLIPEKDRVQEPMSFEADDPAAAPDEYQSTDDLCLIDFYINSIRDDILGIASNAHLALCDKSEQGSFDENAKKLARICSKQVDSLRAASDLALVRQYAPKEYPDFMQSRDKPLYPSTGVLGKMYRRCKTLMVSTTSENARPSIPRDEEYLVRGYETYLAGAETVYRQYKLRLTALLQMSGATSEAELFTGMIVEPPSIHKANYFRFGEQCKDAFYALQDSFREQFHSQYGNLSDTEHQKVAAAWYFVAYNDNDTKTRYLSFPFIVIKFLIVNKTTYIREPQLRVWTPLRRSNFAETTPKLQLSLLAEVILNAEELLSDLFDRLVAVSNLYSILPPRLTKKNTDLILFGSSALLTFEKQSDLDIMMSSSKAKGTLKEIAKFLTETMNSQPELRDGIRVPLLSFSVDQWSIEMCQHSSGPFKTWLFRSYIREYPFFWPCLYILVRWGKSVGLIRRRSHGGSNLFSPIGITWLFLEFCLKKKFVTQIHIGSITYKQIQNTNSIESEIEFWTSLLTGLTTGSNNSDTLAAEVLLSFLSYFGSISTPASAYNFSDPYDPENDMQLDDDSIALFRSECYMGFHHLVINNGDVHHLLTHRPDQTSVITLSRALSRRVHEAKEFFARKILMDASAEGTATLVIRFHPNALRSDLYVAEIGGDGKSVQRIEDRIRMLERELGAPVAFRSNQNFHREGASLLLFEGALSQHENIGFQKYFGGKHVQHTMRLDQAHLICFMNGQSWYDHAAATFCAKFVEQMVKLSRYEHQNPSMSTAKAFVRFGHHYLIHLPRSFDAETIMLATIKKLEDEFERGRSARELFESVLVAKKLKREETAAILKIKSKVTEDEQTESNGGRADRDAGDDDENLDDSRSGGGGKGSSAGNGDDGRDGNGLYKPRRRRLPASLSLKNADDVARKDKGVTHSFFTTIDPVFARWTSEYAMQNLGMTQLDSAENFQVSIIHDNYDYNVRLSADLQLVKIATRPARWFSTTLKMRQELDEEHEQMDSTPDIRFYVSLSEEVPSTDEMSKLLTQSCQKSPGGRGIVDFVDPATRDNLRISESLVDAGISPSAVPTIRHVRSETFRDEATDLRFTVMKIREFGVPDRDPTAGYLVETEKTEAEFLMPPLTPERRLKPEFAREFLATGVRFVEFLRLQANLVREEG